MQGLQGQGASALQKVLPQEISLDLRMGSQMALLAMGAMLLITIKSISNVSQQPMFQA